MVSKVLSIILVGTKLRLLTLLQCQFGIVTIVQR